VTVDAKLEIESCRAGRGYPDGSKGLAALDVAPLWDRNVLQISVQTEVLAAVINDDEAAKAGKHVGERHRAVVNRPDGQSLGRCNVDPIVDAAPGL
jgi:hypothetical protein